MPFPVGRHLCPANKKQLLEKAKPLVSMNDLQHFNSSSLISGEKRNRIMAEVLSPSTAALLQKIQLRNGMCGLDLGCGTGEVTFQLAERVGWEGTVTGMDQDADKIQTAREKQYKNGVTNTEFILKNITEWQESERYDFVYSRLLLNRLRQPPAALQNVYRSIKSGGVAIVEDLDYSNYYCHPLCYAFDRYLELYIEAKKQQGTDAHIGHKLLPLLETTGFQKIQVQMIPATFLSQRNKPLASVTLEAISAVLMSEQLVSSAELKVLLDELRAFEQRTDTLITAPGIYQAWGFK